MNILTHNPEQQLSVKAKAFLARPKKLYINGEFVDAAGGETFETEDPALGTAITEVSSAKKEDVERAAVAARDAFDKRWSTLAPAQRGAYLSKLADLISENLEEFAHLEAYDTGKPVSVASGEIWFAAETYRYYAGWATKLSGRKFRSLTPSGSISLRYPAAADRGSGRDRCLELPLRPDKLESCSGACGGMHHDSEAGGTDAAYRVTACGTLR
jgi:delta 1-pyrroline-5-carboxylate dehydrogenase